MPFLLSADDLGQKEIREPVEWFSICIGFENNVQVNDNVHYKLVQGLLNVKKIPRHGYVAKCYTIKSRKEMEWVLRKI